VARLVEGWLSSGLSGYVSMEALVSSWDQGFICGWHLLARACARVLLKLKVDVERGMEKGWEHCLTVVATAPLRLTPSAMRECFRE
jgi:hypothetical protein